MTHRPCRIVCRDSGEEWREYLKWLAEAEGIEIHDEEDLRRFDQQRKKQGKKKVSNDEWTSPVDPDSRIIKMKDGRTHLGYKAEHVVDLQSEYILSADVVHGTASSRRLLPYACLLPTARRIRRYQAVALEDE